MSHQDFLAQRHFPSLDAIRCFSVVAVVWHHARPADLDFGLAKSGFLGVDMFFALSGFLIVTLLLREKDKWGRVSMRDFYIRRTLRIFPLYYAVILFLLVLGVVKGNPELMPVSDLPWLLTYTSNWTEIAGLMAIGWSLATEEQFYLVWPWIEKLSKPAIAASWVTAFMVSQAANFSLLDPFLPVGHRHDDLEILQATFAPILLGVALAHILHGERSFRRLFAALSSPATPLLCFCGVLGVASAFDDLSGFPRLGIHLFMTVLLGSLVVRRETCRGLFTWQPIVHVGKVSYGVYLLHMVVLSIVMKVVEKLGVDVPGVLFILTMAGTWFAAALSFRFFESWFLDLKKKFQRPAHS